MEENASKVLDAPDALASAAVLGASGPLTTQGSLLFVINLCASMAPIANVGKTLPGLENYRLYQVSRREDGRTRHRLRLGFFATEADAENVLNSVRDAYPTAFTACLCDEDRRFARGYVPESSKTPVAALAPATPKIAVLENKPKPSAPDRSPSAATVKGEAAQNIDSTAKHPALKTAAKPVDNSTLLEEVLAAQAAETKPAARPQATKPIVAPTTATSKVDTAKLDSTAKHRALKPAAKPAVVEAPAPAAAAIDEFKFIDDELAAMAGVPERATTAAASSPDHAAEVEFDWDPPALSASAPQTVVSPAFKTQDVIKAPDRSPSAAMGRSPSAAVTGVMERPSAGAQERPPTPPAPPKAADKPAAAERAKPAIATTPPAKQTGRKDVIEKPSNLLATIEFTLESEPTAPVARAADMSSNEPFRVSKGVEFPAISLTLDDLAPATKLNAPASAVAQTSAAKPASAPAAQTPAAKPAPVPAAKAPPAPAKPAAKAKPAPAPDRSPGAAVTGVMERPRAGAPERPPAAAPPTGAPSALAKQLSALPDLDSTQTIRALTSDELNDDSQEKWFAIQLAVSDQPVNLDTMPRLDIFEAYRLYSVASAGSGKITHHLRIGFFREEVSAEAVSGYLKTFFNSPTVVRISIAEQARFKDPPSAGAQARPPVAKPAPKADAKVLDLSHARERTTKPVPTVTMAVETPRFDPNATGSFKANATGTHKALATGTHKAMNATGTHKALSATGKHKALKPASKSPKSAATGKHKALQSKKSLSQQLMDEAREVELSESGIRKLPKNNSLLSKMLGKLTK